MEWDITIMNFSGVYPQQCFWKKHPVTWIELGDISGTNCYCDDEAIAEIRKRIQQYPVSGIHFIDSGNYHYMTRIWLEKINTPFRLLVFDNHTDMQPPAFGGLLSCGGWIADAFDEIENLRQVVLVGPDAEAFSQVSPQLRERVSFFSREALEKAEDLKSLSEIPTDLPLYISIDKDILSPEYARTAWSQGDITIERLAGFLKALTARFRKEGGRILGADICGECPPEQTEGNGMNDSANKLLLDLFL